jgi:hypothetical protein
MTYTRDDDVLVTVNGATSFVQKEDPEFSGLDEEWKKKYGRDVWDAVVFIRFEPTHIVAFAVNPELYPTA